MASFKRRYLRNIPEMKLSVEFGNHRQILEHSTENSHNFKKLFQEQLKNYLQGIYKKYSRTTEQF